MLQGLIVIDMMTYLCFIGLLGRSVLHPKQDCDRDLE